MKNITFNQICNTAILRSGALNTKNIQSLLERLVLTLIEIEKYETFSKDQLCDDFDKFYKLRLTKMMFGEICPNLLRFGYITKNKNNKNEFFVATSKFKENSLAKDYNSFVDQKEMFISFFVQYAHNAHFSIKKTDAENMLASYIEESVESLGTTIETKTIEDKALYIIYSFINYIKDKEPTYYSIYENIVIGRMLATFIMSNDLNIDKNNEYSRLNVYLDSGFIFRTLGLDLYSSSDEYVELVSTLRGLGAKLYVFSHVYQEISQIIESSKIWIDNDEYSLAKSSKVTEYFLSNKYTAEEIDEYFYTLKTKLSKLGIEIIDYEIDYNQADSLYEKDVEKMIVDQYQCSEEDYDYKAKTYNIDAKSIYSIHKLRKHYGARTIGDAKHIFVTTNKALAKVANKYNSENYGNGTIAYAITDTFLSVLLFFTYANYSVDVSNKFFVPAAYHAFEPSKALIKKIEKTLTDLKGKQLISEADSFAWKTNSALKQYVLDMTNNSQDNFDETTPDKVMKKIQEEADTKVTNANLERDRIAKSNNETIEETIADLRQEITNIDSKNNKIAKRWSIAICVLIIVFIGIFTTIANICSYNMEWIENKWPVIITISIIGAVLFLVSLFISPMVLKTKIEKGILKAMEKKCAKIKQEKETKINKLKDKMIV